MTYPTKLFVSTLILIIGIASCKKDNSTDSSSKTKIENTSDTENQKAAESTIEQIVVEGSIAIAELVKNPKKYEGQTIQLSGICTKINTNIMGRNWIHLIDGSKDDFDLVITSHMEVPEGDQVTMTGTVVIDKDFGAGYKYEVIVENGEVINAGAN